MRKAFTLVEIIIVVTVLGILAAVVIPAYTDHITSTKETAAKRNLQILRGAIERYAAQHNGTPPGYFNGDSSGNPNIAYFVQQLTMATNEQGQITGDSYGPYLSEIPQNPLSDTSLYLVWMVGNDGSFPDEATGETVYIYKAATKTIRLNWPGTDTEGVAYYDY